MSTTDESAELVRERTCPGCGKQHISIVSMCPDCAEARLAEIASEEARQKEAMRLSYWRAICPQDYQSTDWSNPALSAGCRRVRQWRLGTPAGQTCLGLFGESGIGKTRAAFAVLNYYFLAGYSVYAVHSSNAWDSGENIQGLSSAARLQFDDEAKVRDSARDCLNRARSCSVLLIDDVGKESASRDGRVSEAVGEALYSLIENRIANGRSIIWTCNMAAGDIEARLGPDRGWPTMRRLRDKSFIPEL